MYSMDDENKLVKGVNPKLPRAKLLIDGENSLFV